MRRHGFKSPLIHKRCWMSLDLTILESGLIVIWTGKDNLPMHRYTNTASHFKLNTCHGYWFLAWFQCMQSNWGPGLTMLKLMHVLSFCHPGTLYGWGVWSLAVSEPGGSWSVLQTLVVFIPSCRVGKIIQCCGRNSQAPVLQLRFVQIRM